MTNQAKKLSCTAGGAAFIMAQCVFRSRLDQAMNQLTAGVVSGR
jgi:hypothetical protein